ncbi:aspartic peptidase A1 [Lenzites betulinus]|nr:aspartic peptidase A1 [Lenzites betulinus]
MRLPFAKHVNLTGLNTLLERDRLRARAYAPVSGTGPSPDAVGNVPVDNMLSLYVANVSIGTPPTTYSLMVDTGSSNTWVGAGKAFTKTSSTRETGERVGVSYGLGNFTGNEFIDDIELAPGLTIKGQSFGVATSSNDFTELGVDGILGIGPTNLTFGTLSPDSHSVIPTVTDNLASQHVIIEKLVSISFTPTNSQDPGNGELTFGGIDPSKFLGSIHMVPLTHTFPASRYFGIDQSIAYGPTTIMTNTAGIVDTGTSLIYIPTESFQRYQQETGGVFDENTGLLRITPAQFDKLHSLFYNINGATFELVPNAQIWPRSLNSVINGQPNAVYLIVADIGQVDAPFSFINGQMWLERFYAVFDSGNNRFGVANTQFTHATVN